MNFERYMASMRLQDQLVEGKEIIQHQDQRNKLLLSKNLLSFKPTPQQQLQTRRKSITKFGVRQRKQLQQQELPQTRQLLKDEQEEDSSPQRRKSSTENIHVEDKNMTQLAIESQPSAYESRNIVSRDHQFHESHASSAHLTKRNIEEEKEKVATENADQESKEAVASKQLNGSIVEANPDKQIVMTMTDLKKSFIKPNSKKSHLKSTKAKVGTVSGHQSNQDLISVIDSSQVSPTHQGQQHQEANQPDLSRWKTQTLSKSRESKKHKRTLSHSNDYARVQNTQSRRRSVEDDTSRAGSSQQMHRSVDSKFVLKIKNRLDQKSDENINSNAIEKNVSKRRASTMNQTGELFSKPVLEKSVEQQQSEVKGKREPSLDASTEKFAQSLINVASPNNMSITTFQQEEISPLKSTLKPGGNLLNKLSNMDDNNESQETLQAREIVANEDPYLMPMPIQNDSQIRQGDGGLRQKGSSQNISQFTTVYTVAGNTLKEAATPVGGIAVLLPKATPEETTTTIKEMATLQPQSEQNSEDKLKAEGIKINKDIKAIIKQGGDYVIQINSRHNSRQDYGPHSQLKLDRGEVITASNEYVDGGMVKLDQSARGKNVIKTLTAYLTDPNVRSSYNLRQMDTAGKAAQKPSESTINLLYNFTEAAKRKSGLSLMPGSTVVGRGDRRGSRGRELQSVVKRSQRKQEICSLYRLAYQRDYNSSLSGSIIRGNERSTLNRSELALPRVSESDLLTSSMQSRANRSQLKPMGLLGEQEPKLHFSQFQMPQSQSNYLESEYVRIDHPQQQKQRQLLQTSVMQPQRMERFVNHARSLNKTSNSVHRFGNKRSSLNPPKRMQNTQQQFMPTSSNTAVTYQAPSDDYSMLRQPQNAMAYVGRDHQRRSIPKNSQFNLKRSTDAYQAGGGGSVGDQDGPVNNNFFDMSNTSINLQIQPRNVKGGQNKLLKSYNMDTVSDNSDPNQDFLKRLPTIGSRDHDYSLIFSKLKKDQQVRHLQVKKELMLKEHLMSQSIPSRFLHQVSTLRQNSDDQIRSRESQHRQSNVSKFNISPTIIPKQRQHQNSIASTLNVVQLNSTTKTDGMGLNCYINELDSGRVADAPEIDTRLNSADHNQSSVLQTAQSVDTKQSPKQDPHYHTMLQKSLWQNNRHELDSVFVSVQDDSKHGLNQGEISMMKEASESCSMPKIISNEYQPYESEMRNQEVENNQCFTENTQRIMNYGPSSGGDRVKSKNVDYEDSSKDVATLAQSRETVILSDQVLDDRQTKINLKINVTEKQIPEKSIAEFICHDHQQSPSKHDHNTLAADDDHMRPLRQMKNMARQKELLSKLINRNIGRHKPGVYFDKQPKQSRGKKTSVSLMPKAQKLVLNNRQQIINSEVRESMRLQGKTMDEVLLDQHTLEEQMRLKQQVVDNVRVSLQEEAGSNASQICMTQFGDLKMNTLANGNTIGYDSQARFFLLAQEKSAFQHRRPSQETIIGDVIENETYATPREPRIEKVPMLQKETDNSPSTVIAAGAAQRMNSGHYYTNTPVAGRNTDKGNTQENNSTENQKAVFDGMGQNNDFLAKKQELSSAQGTRKQIIRLETHYQLSVENSLNDDLSGVQSRVNMMKRSTLPSNSIRTPPQDHQ